MSIAAVAHRHVFGLKADVKDNIAFLDEQNVIYPAGSNSILFNTENKSQKFIPVTEHCEGITAMAVSSNKRHVVIAERSERPLASIYDVHTLRKRKALTVQDTDSKEFVCMAFSSDAKYIVTQSGAPDWTLYFWTWEKTKLMASIRTAGNPGDKHVPSSTQPSPTGAVLPSPTVAVPGSGSSINRVSFCPSDNTQICVIGNGIFKLLRYAEGALKSMPLFKVEIKNYLCQCWTVDEKIVIGSDDGHIFIFETNGEFKADILISPDPNVIKPCYAIATYGKGFVAACGGAIVTYEKADDAMASAAAQQISVETNVNANATKELFRKTREFALPDENLRIMNMALAPSEDVLVCALENSQLYSIVLGSAEVKADDAKFEVFSQPFHHGQITGMDTCIRKPLIVTCSSDRSVRVWNYMESSSELVKYFSEEAFSVAIHPSGLYILVGFSDKLRMMNLLIDDMRTFKEFTVRGCRECKFSNGGQYFAAVHGNTIQIYSTWSFENLGNLKGHNGKVRSLHWTPDDSKIVTAGMDGAIYDWSLKDIAAPDGTGAKREGESILKSCSYTSAVSTPDGKSIFAVGSDKTLKEIVDSQIVRELESDTVLTQVALSHSGRMMFVGTANGTIRSMKFPLGNEPGEYQEHQGHSGAISKLRVSYDDSFLFSSSDDGCLYIFKVSDKEGRGLKREKEIAYADEILVTKSDLEEKNSMMTELKTRVEELKMENEYQLRLKDMNFNEKIKEVTEKFMQEIEALKITSTVLRTDKEKEEVRHEEEMAEERDRHSKELLELETVHNAKLMAEYEKFQELQQKTMELQMQWERQMKDMQAAKEKALNDLTNHFEIKIKERQAEIDQVGITGMKCVKPFEQLQDEIKKQYQEFEETTKETEEDADAEILELKHRYERKLKEEREIGLRLKGENGIMRKKFNSLQSEIDSHKAEIAKMYTEEKKLHSVIKSLEKDIAGLKKEIQERDETIQDKEKRIYDLKKKNQELEKFKFVLDYKIKELKRQIEPREQDIQGMTQQIKEMDVELEHYHKTNSNLELAIADLKLKLKAAEKEVQTERARVKACCATIKRFKVDLHECVQYIQEPKLLKAHLKKLYQKYCKDAVQEEETIDPDVQQEYSRQRDYLERTVTSLRRKAGKDQGMHRSDNVRIMQENVSLIKEINTLRRDLRNVRAKEKAAELALKQLPQLFVLAITSGLGVLVWLAITAHVPRKPFDSELHYIDVLTGKRHKFPSLTDQPSAEASPKQKPTTSTTLRSRKAGTGEHDQAADDLVLISVIVPAYNETARLPAMLEEAIFHLEGRKKADPTFKYEIIVVDDGSKDATAEVARKFAADQRCSHVRVLKLEKNRGKGGAVTQGILSSRGEKILFADADGATRFSDVDVLEAALDKSSKSGQGIAIGSRAHMVKTDAVVKRSMLRNFLMYGFHTYLLILGIAEIKDTQCGFKMFTRDAARSIFPSVHVEGWIFDIEILLIASWLAIPMVEVPVNWHEVDGSKMSLLKDSVKMAIDLLIIRLNYMSGIWKIKKSA